MKSQVEVSHNYGYLPGGFLIIRIVVFGVYIGVPQFGKYYSIVICLLVGLYGGAFRAGTGLLGGGTPALKFLRNLQESSASECPKP